MFALSLFLNGRCRRDRDDYLQISCRSVIVYLQLPVILSIEPRDSPGPSPQPPRSLPYLQDVNTALGLVVKFYLEGLITSASAASTDADSAHAPLAPAPTQSQFGDALVRLDDTFTSCSDVRSDLKRGFDFWDRVVAGVHVLHHNKSIPEELAVQFVEADRWVKERRF
ncbi:temperature dependent protein affecting M2 dsRNA replication-domain-containing protein [Jimgerdemannia flammicorona]|uniref:Temperature dependent protein affecting M2 dsRNA replication-domain-containing protein n=1 Tax=Jimgerdemannia flammicorona TaxID=994334 RepID=A0A432ZZC7_9FUNG|nr:temperature dependent protein affecting M2 dsRNA replication-domain-containing protein [Jimgerdemannia flammicorona]